MRNNPYKYTDPTGNSVTPYHAIGTYNALRELGFGRIESLKLAYDSMTPDAHINDPDYYKAGEKYQTYHLDAEISDQDKESILRENAQKFKDAYQTGEKDAGRYLHVFGDTMHQGGYPAGTSASTSDKVNHLLSDLRPANIKTTKDNIVEYLGNIDSRAQSSSMAGGAINQPKPISSRVPLNSKITGRNCLFCSKKDNNKKGGK